MKTCVDMEAAAGDTGQPFLASVFRLVAKTLSLSQHAWTGECGQGVTAGQARDSVKCGVDARRFCTPMFELT